MELIPLSQFKISRGGPRRRDPFAKTFTPLDLPDGDYVVVELASPEFGNALVVWDSEDAEYFYGFSVDDWMRGNHYYPRMFSRSFWRVDAVRGFDNKFGAFDAWLECDYCNGRGI